MIGKFFPDFEVKDSEQFVDNDNYLGLHQTKFFIQLVSLVYSLSIRQRTLRY